MIRDYPLPSSKKRTCCPPSPRRNPGRIQIAGDHYPRGQRWRRRPRGDPRNHGRGCATGIPLSHPDLGLTRRSLPLRHPSDLVLPHRGRPLKGLLDGRRALALIAELVAKAFDLALEGSSLALVRDRRLRCPPALLDLGLDAFFMISRSLALALESSARSLHLPSNLLRLQLERVLFDHGTFALFDEILQLRDLRALP